MSVLSAIFSNTVVAFIILIGVVVFVHELGHFLAGKAFGIGIEEFAIGFGPKAFSFHKGQTEYRVNWLPLGGYVRFLDTDSKDEAKRDQTEKGRIPLPETPVYQRAIVSFAGPFANFVLSFFLMMAIHNKGLPELPPVVSVIAGSVATQSGLRTGDRITAIDGQAISTWTDISKKVEENPGKKLLLQVERAGKTLQVAIVPQSEALETPFGNTEQKGRIGVAAAFVSPHLFVPQGSLFSLLNIETGSRVISLNGTPIDYFFQIEDKWQDLTGTSSVKTLAEKIAASALQGKTMTIEWQNGEKKQRATLAFDSVQAKTWAQTILQDAKKHSGKNEDLPVLVSSDQVLAHFPSLGPTDKLLPAEQALKNCGLLPGSAILAVNPSTNQTTQRFFSAVDVMTQIQALTAPRQPSTTPKTGAMTVAVTLLSEKGSVMETLCSLPVRQGFDSLNRARDWIDFPVQFVSQNTLQKPRINRPDTVFALMKESALSVWQQITMTFRGVKMLVTGAIPIANLGGPIAIAQVAGDAAQSGLLSFVFIMAFLSTNIGFMNLLPLPVLDGGTLLLLAIEAAYGKKLPQKAQFAIQKAGILILITLFVIVFYNDAFRLLHLW